jgi:hypothetical protein
MAAMRCEALHNRAPVRGCKFQSENGPEYKKKYGGKSRAKVYHSPPQPCSINPFFVIQQSLADSFFLSESLTRSELPGT